MKNIKESLKTLVEDTKSEAQETKEMAGLIWESKDRKLSIEEKKKIKEQSIDVFKITILGGLFVVPFSGVLIVFLIKFGKKFGINILPSSFNKNKIQ